MNALTPGGRIDESRPFKPVRIAVLTVSDTRTEADDTSGDLLAERVRGAGHELAARAIVRDDIPAIREQIKAWAASGVEAIVSTGGTGVTGRDVTVEAVRPLFDKELEGFAVVFHLVSYQTVGLSTLQSRACAGIVGGCFVFCLPGSNGAVKDGWDKVIAAQLDARDGPCNFVEQMPRLAER
ncbi:MAG: molybdenum cofactor biosynthesis protein B [Phenylobacterium sp.]